MMPQIRTTIVTGLLLAAAPLAHGDSATAPRPRPRVATMPALLPPSPTTTPAASDDAALLRLKELSAAQRALYARVAGSLVRVRVEQNLDSVLPEQLRAAYDAYRERLASRGGERDKGAPGRPMVRPGVPRPGEGVRRPEGPATGPSRSSVQALWLLERFLEQRTGEANAADAAEAQALLSRVRAMRSGVSGEMYAVVYDAQGHALLLSAVALPKDREKLQAYAADGTELSAKVLATDARRGLTVLEIDSPGQATPAALAEGRPVPGDLLMCLSVTGGTVRWVSAPLPPPGRRRDERFAVSGFDDRAGLLFNTEGQLAAVVIEKMAVPVSVIASDLAALQAGRTIEPRTLGVKYDPVPLGAAERGEHKLLGFKPALRVSEVLADSAAQKAGIQKGDYIVSIDGKPVTQIRQVLAELATKTTPLRVGLVRGDESLEREIPLEK